MVNGSMQQEELMILNIYAPNTRPPRYIKQVLNDLQRDLDSYTIIVGEFNTPLSILDRSTRKKQKNLPAKTSTDWPIMSQAVKHLFASAPLLHWEKLTSKPV